jgi:hypothetical protein
VQEGGERDVEAEEEVEEELYKEEEEEEEEESGYIESKGKRKRYIGIFKRRKT